MIKKIVFLIIFVIILNSCGRKGDPEYKEDNKNQVNLKVLTKQV